MADDFADLAAAAKKLMDANGSHLVSQLGSLINEFKDSTSQRQASETIAELLFEHDHFGALKNWCQQQQGSYPSSQLLQLYLGLGYANSGLKNRARRVFHQLLAANDWRAFLPALKLADAAQLGELCGMAGRIHDNEVLNRAGYFLADNKQPALALKLFTQAVNNNPEDADALSGLGYLLLLAGDFASAEQHLTKAIRLDPACAPAYLALCNCGRVTERDDPKLEVIRSGLDKITDQDSVINIHFSLGKIYDDLQDYAQAFKHFHQANELRKAQIPEYDFERLEQRLKRLPQVATEQIEFTDKNYPIPVFVLGMPRSGTTLVNRKIAEYSGAHSAGETGMLFQLNQWLEQQKGLAYPDYLPLMTNSECEFLRDEYFSEISGRRSDLGWVIDKTPMNFFWLDLINKLLPEARIVHCRRNMLDCTLSNYFQNFVNSELTFSFDLAWIERFHDYYLRMTDLAKSRLALAWYEVDYEQMTTETDRVMRQLELFLGLGNAANKSADLDAKLFHTASVWQARQKVYQSSVERWRNYQKWIPDLAERHAGNVSSPP